MCSGLVRELAFLSVGLGTNFLVESNRRLLVDDTNSFVWRTVRKEDSNVDENPASSFVVSLDKAFRGIFQSSSPVLVAIQITYKQSMSSYASISAWLPLFFVFLNQNFC